MAPQLLEGVVTCWDIRGKETNPNPLGYQGIFNKPPKIYLIASWGKGAKGRKPDSRLGMLASNCCSGSACKGKFSIGKRATHVRTQYLLLA